jgi:hypothetical protein
MLNKILKRELDPLVKTPTLKRLKLEASLSELRANLNEARKELNAASKTRLVEFKTSSLSKVDPNFKTKKPWTDIKAETALKYLGAKPFSLGINPHGYELDASNDRLWFYSDGSMWSTNATRKMGYTIAPGGKELIIWNDAGGDKSKTGFKLGTLKVVGGQPKFEISTENIEKSKEAAKPAEEEDTSLLGISGDTLDTIQTVLDWVGFIPVLGDIVDIFNALIYFLRGKTFEGFLSCLAIIPIVGSGIKMGIKTLYKGARLQKLVEMITASFKTAKTNEIWAELARSGAISGANLKKVGTGLESIADAAASSHNGIRLIPGIDANAVIKELDTLETWMRNSGRSIDDLAGASKRGGSKAIYGTAPEIVDKISSPILKNFGNSLTFNLVPKLKKLPWFPEQKVKNIAAGLEKRFAREMSADPTKLTMLVRATPNRGLIEKELSNLFNTRLKNLPKADQASYIKSMMSAGLVKNNRVALESAGDIEKFLRHSKNNPAIEGTYDAAADAIVNYAKKNDSLVWSGYKTDRLNNLKTVLSRDMIPDGSNLAKEMDFSFGKNIDIIWNEMQDMGESFGLKDKDEANGVIWPIVTTAVAEYLPGVYDAGVETKTLIKQFNDNPKVKAAKDYFTDKSQLPYDPVASQGGQYK